MLIGAEKITKSYSEKVLLNESSFYLSEKNKVGVIGINGSGKSTLLRMMAFQESPDCGNVINHASARIAYLPQNPVVDENLTVIEYVFKGASLKERELQEYEAKTILIKLGIAEFDKPLLNLSGGQKKRVAMAAVLAMPFEVLILDEPTNHLDNNMILWLENYLINYAGAVIMVTHDRYFLNRVVSKIVEIEQGTLYSYDGNYSKYLELKELRRQRELGTQRKRKSLLRQELEWISRGARARATKSKSRIERFEELMAQNMFATESRLSLSSISTRLGKKTIEINNISKSFDNKCFINDFDYIISRNDRIGIVGENGCGKTTLLNIISGRLAPDRGFVVFGETVKLGYFSQECDEMDLSARVIDYIKSFGEYIETVDGNLSASQMLERFLFPPHLQWNIIGNLSGGERRRLFLLSIVMGAPNILFLDEPTNDLDIETLMVMEDYLEHFNGAVIVVSHDRYFLDKVVDCIFEFQNDGKIRRYVGGYSDYIKAMALEASAKNSDITTSVKKTQPVTVEFSVPKKLRFTFKEQREYEEIDGEIADIENRLAEIEQEIISQASNYEKLQELMERKSELERQLDEKMERWVYLNELAEKIVNKSN